MSAAALACALGDPAQAQLEDFLEHARQDPQKIRSAEACGECHIAEHEVWKGTPHSTGFKTLHKKESAESIARKMGFRLIKRRSLCFGCHYTPQTQNGETRAISGVSCESCHGAGADWIDVHNDYGAGNDYRSEPAAHRAARIERSRAAGMRRPSDLYPVAANCFSCHTVPNEELVNVGGHSTGSATFELVEWSQGEIRHNFLSTLRGTGSGNAESPLERKRLLYVTGRAMDLEFSVRGMAVASEQGVYAKAMSRRVRVALSELRAIAARESLPEVDRMLAAVKEVRVAPGNQAALLAAAERIEAATKAFLRSHDGERLATLDGLVLGLEEDLPPIEDALQIAEAPATSETGGTGGAPATTGGQPTTPSTTPATTPGPGAPPPASQGVPAEGRVKSRIRPAERYQTLGPGSCTNCHGDQVAWWYGHKHSESANPFFERARDNVKIARLYGMNPATIGRGDSLCMDCHGSVVSGRERREVQDGVGCEECHGPAAEWLEPHKDETGLELGRNRPGHLAALKLGKRDLRDLGARAKVCTDCHYITDPRLISSGHPSGDGFDYVSGMSSVRHWEHGPAPAGQIASAFDRVLAARGAVPRVRRASLGGAPSAPSSSGAGPASGETPPVTLASETVESAAGAALDQAVDQLRGLLPRSRPASSSAVLPVSGQRSIDLPEFPEIDESATVEEILVLVRDRLRMLYERVRPSP